MDGFSADNLTSMVEKVTSANRSSGGYHDGGLLRRQPDLDGRKGFLRSHRCLGRIKMNGYDSSRLSGMVEKITSGSTKALGKIK